MNIKELAEQAGFTEDDYDNPALFKIIERFAELVREDEREQMGLIGRDLIAAEREACARFCDRAAKSIRAKNKK
jgi:hypothetical protein